MDIHFIHVRLHSKRQAPCQADFMTHGSPGFQVIELLETIGPLTDPTAHGGHAEDAFELAAAAVPFRATASPASRPSSTGRRPARSRRSLGGADAPPGLHPLCRPGRGRWGPRHRQRWGRQAPEGLVGIHINLLPAVAGRSPTSCRPNPRRNAPRSRAFNTFRESGFGYFLEDGHTRPQTIGYALLDSPVALAAWLLDHDTDISYKISRAFVDGEPAGNL